MHFCNKSLDSQKYECYYIGTARNNASLEVRKIMSDKMQLLKQKITGADMTQDALASKIGMNPSTFYRKVKIGVDAFTVGEMRSLANALNLTGKEVKDIFLN